LLRAERVAVFAVDDSSAQVCWGSLPRGEVVFEAGGVEVAVEGDGAPGAIELRGLPSGARLELTMRGPRRGRSGRRRVAGFRTLTPPPGRLLGRFATVNDLHIGAHGFGLFFEMTERDAEAPHPVRCLRAALAEARDWGADAVVVKGDLTHGGRPWEWEVVGRELGAAGMPVVATPGNHDVVRLATDGTAILARYGIQLLTEPAAVDLPGITAVVVNTTERGAERGIMPRRRRREVTELVAAAGGPVFLAMHHYPQRFRLPTMWPPGIPSPNAVALLDAVAEANPATFVTSGHSHRHRAHSHGPLAVAEIGSTKDFPGAWAGYAVYEGGILQVVRRVAEPSAIAWTDRTRWAVGGIWGLWSPGFRDHRCFTHLWPRT